MKRLFTIILVFLCFGLVACNSSTRRSSAAGTDIFESMPELPQPADADAPADVDASTDADGPADSVSSSDMVVPMDVPGLQDIADTGPTNVCLGTEETFAPPHSVTFDYNPGSFLDMYQMVSLIDVSPGLGVGEHTFLVRLWDYVECLDGGCDWDSGAQNPPGVTGAKFITDSSCADNAPCTNTWHHQEEYAASSAIQIVELGNGYYQVSGLLIPSAGSWEFRFAVEGWSLATFHFCVTEETIPGGNIEDWSAEANPSDATDGIDMSDFGEDSNDARGSSGTDGTDSAT